MDVVIATIKTWNIENAKAINIPKCNINLICCKEDLTYEKIREIRPRYVFFIHWSWYIPEEIYKNFECIVFHPTPLPYGRGGSPIQNLIVRGFEETVVSAVRVSEELDGGSLYPIQRPLSLQGTVEEILIRMSRSVCSEMIPWIISEQPEPCPQEGEVVVFDRRKESDGQVNFSGSPEEIYDMIRMLDGEGYPPSFILLGNYRLTFSRASLKSDGIKADVFIRKEISNEQDFSCCSSSR